MPEMIVVPLISHHRNERERAKSIFRPLGPLSRRRRSVVTQSGPVAAGGSVQVCSRSCVFITYVNRVLLDMFASKEEDNVKGIYFFL